MRTRHSSPTTFWSTSNSTSMRPSSGLSLSFQSLLPLHGPSRITSRSPADATAGTARANSTTSKTATALRILDLLHPIPLEPTGLRGNHRLRGTQGRMKAAVSTDACSCDRATERLLQLGEPTRGDGVRQMEGAADGPWDREPQRRQAQRSLMRRHGERQVLQVADRHHERPPDEQAGTDDRDPGIERRAERPPGHDGEGDRDRDGRERDTAGATVRGDGENAECGPDRDGSENARDQRPHRRTLQAGEEVLRRHAEQRSDKRDGHAPVADGQKKTRLLLVLRLTRTAGADPSERGQPEQPSQEVLLHSDRLKAAERNHGSTLLDKPAGDRQPLAVSRDREVPVHEQRPDDRDGDGNGDERSPDQDDPTDPRASQAAQQPERRLLRDRVEPVAQQHRQDRDTAARYAGEQQHPRMKLDERRNHNVWTRWRAGVREQLRSDPCGFLGLERDERGFCLAPTCRFDPKLDDAEQAVAQLLHDVDALDPSVRDHTTPRLEHATLDNQRVLLESVAEPEVAHNRRADPDSQDDVEDAQRLAAE